MNFINGNYKEWEQISKEIIPSINDKIENQLLNGVTNVLYSMLGAHMGVIQYSQADIYQTVNNGKLDGVKCELIFTVPDFIVPEAPKDAIRSDEEAIKEALASLGTTEVKIDVNEGRMTLIAEYPFKIGG